MKEKGKKLKKEYKKYKKSKSNGSIKNIFKKKTIIKKDGRYLIFYDFNTVIKDASNKIRSS
jgi:protein associated with RNAse G/E